MANWVERYLEANPALAALPIHKRAKHGLHFRRPDGSIEAHIVGKPCHYEATPGVWEPIDTALVDHGTYHKPTGVPIRYANDEVSIEGGSYKQKPARLVRLRPSTGQIQQFSNIPSGGTISGDTVAKSGTGWTHTTRFLEDGVRETLTLSEQPSFPGGTQDTDYICVETVVTGKTWTDGWVDSEYTADGYFFPLPTAHDAADSRPQVRRYAVTDGGVQYLYTGVTVGWLKAATYPVYIDPDFAGSTDDGAVYGEDGTWSTAHSTGYDCGNTSQSDNVGQNYFTVYDVYRLLLKFPTNTIGADSTVTQVNLKLTPTYDASVTDFDVQIVKYDWSGSEPIAYGVRDTLFDGVYNATADDNIWRNTSGIVINTQYTSGNLNTAWINKTGNTYYGLRSSLDKGDSTPTGGEYVTMGMSNNSTEGYRPVLVVVYTEGRIGKQSKMFMAFNTD